MEFQEGGRRQALELAEAKKGGAASQSPAMCDSAAEDVKKENRRNPVSAEPAQQKTALPADQVRVGTPQGCAGEGGSCCCTPGGSMQHAGRQCPHAPRAARGAGVHARCRPLVGACMR